MADSGAVDHREKAAVIPLFRGMATSNGTGRNAHPTFSDSLNVPGIAPSGSDGILHLRQAGLGEQVSPHSSACSASSMPKATRAVAAVTPLLTAAVTAINALSSSSVMPMPLAFSTRLRVQTESHGSWSPPSPRDASRVR